MPFVTGYPFFNGRGWPIIRTPEWRTIVQTADSGKEYRTNCWPSPRWTWKIQWNYLFDDNIWSGSGVETINALSQMQAMFNQLMGQYNTFQYLDPYDNTVPNPVAIAVGDGVTTAFPLFRTVGAGIYTWSEYIQIVAAGLQVYLNGVLTAAYTLGQPPAVVTFTSPPGAGVVISWDLAPTTGAFTFLCRMMKDTQDFSHDFQGVWSIKDLTFKSILA